MPSSKLSPISASLIVLAVVLSGCLLLSAQSTGGRILGRVSDSSGASLGGVKVTATNDATNVSQTAVTNASGEFGFPQVAVGVYSVEFDLSGFKKNLEHGVNVDLNQVV